MSVIHDILKDVPIPRMLHVQQTFDTTRLSDVEAHVIRELSRTEIRERIKPGMEIAITCGSRRIDNIALIIRTVVRFCQDCGAKPFIFPAMGSHGGSQAQGQKEICESYGVTEAYCGCKIRSSMETVNLGMTELDVPAYIDKNASMADGIIVVNRIKAHPGFKAKYESGLMKMMVIGMGKQVGASTCHQFGYSKFPQLLEAIGKKIIKEAPILCGLGIIENAFDQTRNIVGLMPEEIPLREPELLELAKENMPRLLPQYSDVLIIDRMGKDISGGGMDSSITGRSGGTFKPYANFRSTRVAVLDLTEASHRNMGGVGNADIINKRIWEKGDIELTYPNSITHTIIGSDAIPMMMDTDKLAIQCAIKTCNCRDINQVEIIRIRDTLHLRDMMVSEAMVERIKDLPNIIICGEPEPWLFGEEDSVLNCWES